MILLLALGATSVQAQTKVGYTNVELIMSYMPEVQTISKAVEDFKKSKQEEITKKRNYYTQLLQEYEVKSKEEDFSGSTQETELINKVSVLEGEIRKKEASLESDVIRKRNALMQPILNQLQTAINEVAEENGYTYILNQTTGTNILYGVPQFDVTEQIATKLGIAITD
ncbi:MAG: OmpH family outer membrane protein [bacterium]|nr:OmpH family outer membrane protein [bacterium]